MNQADASMSRLELPIGGASQQQVLARLLEQKGGMTVDELADAVGISRTAVNQHLMSLECDGYIRKDSVRKTGGRPGRVYVLTDHGANLFPKKYSWFSRLLIQTLRDQMGQERLSEYMYDLGVQTSADCIPRLVGKTRAERVVEIVKIMNEAGFAARTIAPDRPDRFPRVECKNCVYHDLSKDYPEVCRFDLGFLSGLMGADVDHQECMQRGGEACRFRFLPPA
jgi:DeoR family transcriptional regulator, suf operon transcriptional repressor